jgi:hypothetical protein
MADKWKMDDLHSAFLAEVEKAVIASDVPEEALGAVVATSFEAALSLQVESLAADLVAREKEMLEERRSDQKAFVDRNHQRWEEGFDKLERLIVMSEELGSTMSAALGAAAVENSEAQYEAVISNHARAVLVSREILCLMINGFPDGALARWRTLHEIAVISKFISDHGTEVAERYLEHHHWLSYQRARNYQNHHVRANLTPLAETTIDELRLIAERVVAKRGTAIESDYGWAAEALNNRRPKFTDLENATGLDHWRPRYKWSSTVNHGAYLAPLQGLGTSESIRSVRLVGQSNSGMTDPGHMAAISLTHVTMAVLALEPNLDRIAVFKVMLALSDEVGDALLACSKKRQLD